MKLQVFLEKLNKALDNPSCYLQGGFGQRLLNPGGDWYDKNYSWNKTNAAVIAAHTNTKPVSFGFDCVCLIKGCLWGFSAAPAKAYGGAKYESNKVPDFTIRKLYEAYCYDISEDFSTDPEPGEILFYDKEFSHVGVSIGGGYVIEATPAWKCGVQRTLIANRLNPDAVPVRKWWAHGKTSFIDYESEQPPVTDWQAVYKMLSEKYGKLEAENTQLRVKLEQIKEIVENG